MRIVVLMKSRFSYDRLKGELIKHEIHKFVEGIGDVQECVQYWSPNVAILDQHSPLYEEAKELFFRFNVDVVEFVSDFRSVIEEVEAYSVFHSSDEVDSEEAYIPDLSKFEKQAKQEIAKKEKEVIVEVRREIVEKEVERIAYANIPSKTIVIGSLWSGAGSTLYATNLARAIALRGIQVSYIEYPTARPYMFDYFNIPAIEEIEKFRYLDYARTIKKSKGVVPKGKGWNNKGVQWIVNDTRYPEFREWDYESMLKLVYSLNTPITIIDVSNNWNEQGLQSFLHQADQIYVCLEPDPVKTDRLTTIMGDSNKVITEQRPEFIAMEYIKKVEKEERIPYEYIALKMNKDVNEKEWYQILDKKPVTKLSYIPYEEFISGVWESELLYENAQYKDMFEQSFQPIIKSLLPLRFHFLEEEESKKKFSFNPLKKLVMKGNKE